MTASVFVGGERRDFSDVVEQPGPAQGQGGGYRRGNVGDVGEQIVGVMGAVLVKIQGRFQIGDDGGQNPAIPQQIGDGHQRKEFT